MEFEFLQKLVERYCGGADNRFCRIDSADIFVNLAVRAGDGAAAQKFQGNFLFFSREKLQSRPPSSKAKIFYAGCHEAGA